MRMTLSKYGAALDMLEDIEVDNGINHFSGLKEAPVGMLTASSLDELHSCDTSNNRFFA
jgi:hypothetical protein